MPPTGFSIMRFVLFIFIIFWLPNAIGKTVTLTIDDALALFYQRNLDIIAARYNLELSRAREIIASAIPNPVVSIGLFELDTSRQAGNNGQGPATSFVITQLIETAGKRSLRIESSRFGMAAAEDDLNDALRTFSAAVRQGFYRLLLAQQISKLANENIKRYERLLSVNGLRYEKGDISGSDYMRIKVEAFKARSDLLKSLAEENKNRVDLALLLRWPDDAMNFTAVGEWLNDGVPKNLAEQQLIEKALLQRPDIQAARVRADQAAKELSLARKLVIPDVTVGAGYAHDPSNTNFDTANFSLSVPIPIYYRQKGEIQQATVNLTNAQLQIQQLEQTIRGEVTTAITEWKSADLIVQGYQQDVLEQVQTIRKSAELSYRQGATSIIDLIEAERNYRSVILDYNSALSARTLANVSLLKAIGYEKQRYAQPNTPAH